MAICPLPQFNRGFMLPNRVRHAQEHRDVDWKEKTKKGRADFFSCVDFIRNRV